MAGARWVQEAILERTPSSRLRVYAIWFNMIGSDSREDWPGDLLADRRVVHLWDARRIVGRWYARHSDGGYEGEELWDAYLLYGPAAHWDDAPSHLVSRGRTIMATREELRSSLLPLLEKAPD